MKVMQNKINTTYNTLKTKAKNFILSTVISSMLVGCLGELKESATFTGYIEGKSTALTFAKSGSNNVPNVPITHYYVHVRINDEVIKIEDSDTYQLPVLTQVTVKKNIYSNGESYVIDKN